MVNLVLSKQYTWFITGVAGFIGSHLLEFLLKNDQKVIGLDNFATGFRYNLEDVQAKVTPQQWGNFLFTEGDICDANLCLSLTKNIDYCLHQAAVVSVPWSNLHPLITNQVNVTAFLNILTACSNNNVKRVVYTSTSAVYGDNTSLPQVEHEIGNFLSFYGASKYVNELYAALFYQTHTLEAIGLRYFNVFGARQNPKGEYSAVIPKWISLLKTGKNCTIFGDGKTTRDFCYIENIVYANILSALTTNKEAIGQVYNIANGQETSLNELYEHLKNKLKYHTSVDNFNIIYEPFRDGDVRFSKASIEKAVRYLGYTPKVSVEDGLEKTVAWYLKTTRY